MTNRQRERHIKRMKKKEKKTGKQRETKVSIPVQIVPLLHPHQTLNDRKRAMQGILECGAHFRMWCAS